MRKFIVWVVKLKTHCTHTLHVLGHKAHHAEHPIHLGYFFGLSTGLVDYHMVAIACLVVGSLAMFDSLGGGGGVA